MNYTKENIEELRHRWSTPNGKKLIKIIKSSRCYLSPVLYREEVRNFIGINDEEVRDSIDLRGAPLNGFDFRVSVKEEDTGFSENIAILSNLHLEGAVLKNCNFESAKLFECNFEGADLSHAEFKNSTLNNCQFQEADLTGVNFQSVKLINCFFIDSILKDVVLGNTIIDEKTSLGKTLKAEKTGNFNTAAIEYKQIKEMYKHSSLHDLADIFHYKEMVAKRRALNIKNPKRWLNFIFGDLLCKYGTSFLRVALWSFLIIALCAKLYMHNSSLVYQYSEVSTSYTTALYFSMVTFTTLGFGDYHAVGSMRFLSASEAFIGSALIALFTVIVARKIIRD